MNNNLTLFSYVDNTTLTLAQGRLISSFARHFGYPNKVMRGLIDMDRAVQERLIHFDLPNYVIRDTYYVVNVKLSINKLFSEKSFYKSDLYCQYTLKASDPAKTDSVLVVSSPDLYIVVPYDIIVNGKTALDLYGGGVFLNYEGCTGQVLIPIKHYLDSKFPDPSPPSE
jgi:hypothetical protein